MPQLLRSNSALSTASSSIERAFFSGKYHEVLDTLSQRSIPPELDRSLKATSLRLGALVFTGELPEAEKIFQDASAKEPSVSFLAPSRFFLGVGLIQKSRYEEARALFARNLRLLGRRRKRRSVDPVTMFFCLQGAAFFRFFCGQLPRARKLAQEAHLRSLDSGFLYGQVLALDLMGQCDCQLGFIDQGLLELEKALALACRIGNSEVATSLQVSIARFRARHGVDHRKTETLLRSTISGMDPEDMYSRGELTLELSHQLILRGKTSEARRLLDHARDSIYRNQNSRLSATYHLRYAHLLHLQGESRMALLLLRGTRAKLDAKFDRGHIQQIQELENRIETEIQPDYRPKEGGKSDLTQLFDHALFGLAPQALGALPFESFLYLGPNRGSLLIYSRGDTYFSSTGVTLPMQKLLQLLEGGALRSKKSLVESTWDYRYRIDIHDPLLHATMGKVRRLLGPFASWLAYTGDGYRLPPRVRVISAV